MDTLTINTEEALVRQAQKGDRAAFEEIVRQKSRLLYARVYIEVGDSYRAEDLVQETFLVAFRSIHQLEDPKKLNGWLSAIAQKLTINSFRHETRKKRKGIFKKVKSLDHLPGETQEPFENLKRRELREKALSILRSMPEDYRLPLMLRYFADANYDSISRQLGLSNGSLRGLLNRGMSLLRSEIKRFSQED